jgi:Ca2+:H+ antiporter
LLLTLVITGLEVAMVAFVMSTGVEKPALARDTMVAVVMLVLNGFMGLALLLGGLRRDGAEILDRFPGDPLFGHSQK